MNVTPLVDHDAPMVANLYPMVIAIGQYWCLDTLIIIFVLRFQQRMYHPWETVCKGPKMTYLILYHWWCSPGLNCGLHGHYVMFGFLQEIPRKNPRQMASTIFSEKKRYWLSKRFLFKLPKIAIAMSKCRD